MHVAETMDHHGPWCGQSVGIICNWGRVDGELCVVWPVWRLRDGCFQAAPEAVVLAVHLQDVDVAGEPAQQRPGEPLRAEDPGPLVDGQVDVHQDEAPLAALAEDIEEPFRTGAGQVYGAQLVHY